MVVIEAMTTAAAISTRLHELLSALKAVQLQRLAVALGAPCSGNKATVVQSIVHTSIVKGFDYHAAEDQPKNARLPLSLVSIDMGIRNLAYSCLKAEMVVEKASAKCENVTRYGILRLCAWENIAIAETSSPSSRRALKGSTAITAETVKSDLSQRESFTPDIYASHAFHLLNRIISTHQPTHILIERQRFRSGGSPMVLDWSIRVGIFEGMLWAVLKTLAETKHLNIQSEGMDPARIARFWVDEEKKEKESGAGLEHGMETTAVPKGKELKLWKIDRVGRMLEPSSLEVEAIHPPTRQTAEIRIDPTVQPLVDAYLSRWKKGEGSSRPWSAQSKSISLGSGVPAPVAKLSKLDDLADCLLQGMAWVKWQNNREKFLAAAIDDNIDAVLAL